MVERHLAKVNVASSNLVFRFHLLTRQKNAKILRLLLFVSGAIASGKAEVCKTFTPSSNLVRSMRKLVERQGFFPYCHDLSETEVRTMIYFVEDDASIRELVLYTLNNAGFQAEGFERPSAFWKHRGR